MRKRKTLTLASIRPEYRALLRTIEQASVAGRIGVSGHTELTRAADDMERVAALAVHETREAARLAFENAYNLRSSGGVA